MDRKAAAIRECPNPECRGTRCFTEASFPNYWWVRCPDCELEGPRGASEEDAIRLLNNMPREEPWRKVEDGLPETRGRHDVVIAQRVSEDVLFDSGAWRDTALDTVRGVTHWRPHTPPRGPEDL